jgi:hypothetical protein
MTDTAIIILGAFSVVGVFGAFISCVYFFGLYDVSIASRPDGLHTQENAPPRAEI